MPGNWDKMSECSEMPCVLCVFGFQPHRQFETGGMLAGLKVLSDDASYLTERAAALFGHLVVSPDNLDYFLGELPDGRWALLGPIEEGRRFALERILSE
jgi:hypothetical protein